MDRQIIYPGQIPLSTDLLNTNRNMLVAVAKLAAAMLGTATVVNGLACVPTGPASLQVVVNPGEMYSLANVDATAYGELAADTTHSILKQGISLDDVLLTCNPPVTAGQSINYLIQATYQDSDTGLVTLPYYNASNPSQAWSGPGNSGAQQATVRKGIVNITAKAGIAATTGSQTTPAPDAGFTGLWVVTVANGQTTITSGNIAQVTNAPFISERLGDKISKTTGDVLYAPTGIVGLARNLKMSVASVTSTATLTADEVVLEEALGGKTYRLASFNQNINLATTGAGGMDTGSSPNSGYVALYAIYNPTTQARALLAVNATSTAAPEVYGGSNMPPGYTASALVSVWPTNGSGQFIVGTQIGRSVSRGATAIINTSTTQATFASLAISGVPRNARRAKLLFSTINTNSGTTQTMDVATDAGGSGQQSLVATVGVASQGNAANGYIDIVTPQTIFYRLINNAGGTPTFTLNATGYEF
ncbi:hypothetical protein AEMCBJ_04300 [Cupriavidus necator]|uniref:hypothetical protein n=1 Tax=Cupriavidus necator TaxID=106590 RepID=UPI003F737F91